MNRRFALLVNPMAAGGRPLSALPAVTREWDALNAPYRVVEARDLDQAREEARDAAEQGDVVAALGGDGLVGPIAGELRRNGVLAILPAGRGNDFARVLGIREDPAEAARVAVEGRTRLVDVAEVDGAPYVGIASLGLDSDANRIANETRLVKGNLVYAYAALRALAGWKPATFTVTVDGERHEVTGYSVAVGNSKAYGGGMLLLPHAELDDGKLDVLMVDHYSKLRVLRDVPRAFKGNHLDSPEKHLYRGSVVEVSSDRPFVVYADGDPIGKTPATMRVERRCLEVIVPS